MDYNKLSQKIKEKIENCKDINSKKQMTEMLGVFHEFRNNNSGNEKDEKNEYFNYVKKIEQITKKTDEILQGECILEQSDKDRLKVEFGLDTKLMEIVKLPFYWRDVMKNSKLRWGPKDDFLLEDLSSVDVLTKMDKVSHATESVEIIFNFDHSKNDKAKFLDDKLFVKIIFKMDELSRIENSGSINWTKDVNELGGNSEHKGKGETIQVFESILDIFTTKENEIKDEEPIVVGQIDREEVEKIVDEMVNVVSFSLEYYLGVNPGDEDDQGDFD